MCHQRGKEENVVPGCSVRERGKEDEAEEEGTKVNRKDMAPMVKVHPNVQTGLVKAASRNKGA